MPPRLSGAFTGTIGFVVLMLMWQLLNLSTLEQELCTQLIAHGNSPPQQTTSKMRQQVSTPIKNSNVTHWCVLAQTSMARNSRRFHDHFPHAAENILPCWSWFRAMNATDNCGFALMYGLTFKKNNPQSWQQQLVDRMGCQVKYVNNKKKDRKTPFAGGIFHTVNLKLKQPRYGMTRYLDHPEDAWALRRLFVSDESIATKKGTKLQIGMIERTADRVITNFDEIRKQLEKRLQREADIETTTLAEYSGNLQQQATWFATKDVIVGAHGAAMANSLFVTEGTIVLQLYPENYFFQSLEPLIEQAGGVALDWYPGNDPVFDWRQHRNTQWKWRTSNITPPVNEIVDLVLMGLGEMETPSGWFPRDPYLMTVIQANWSKVLNWMGDV